MEDEKIKLEIFGDDLTVFLTNKTSLNHRSRFSGFISHTIEHMEKVEL